MENMLPKPEPEVRIQGDVFTFYFTVSSTSEQDDEKLYVQFQEFYKDLWARVNILVKEHLGAYLGQEKTKEDYSWMKADKNK